MTLVRIFLLLLSIVSSMPLSADEIRPGYLEINEESAELFSILWKVPQDRNDRTMQVVLPEICEDRSVPTTRVVPGATIQRWYSHCEGGLQGRRIAVTGLEISNTDVLVQLQWRNQTSSTIRLTPADSDQLIPKAATLLEVAMTYFFFGAEHILEGFDHLLFVLALVIIVKDLRLLVVTITSFTIAHSVTLALATLNVINVSQQPVEAVIALSIVFLASEILRSRKDRATRTVEKWPWLVALSFGLLHGLGFANALASVGLPENAIPAALIFFNLGVEVGQLIFIGVILVLGYFVRRILKERQFQWAQLSMVYAIGGTASFWMFERLNAF
jgi:hypothetical protein